MYLQDFVIHIFEMKVSKFYVTLQQVVIFQSLLTWNYKKKSFSIHKKTFVISSNSTT